MIRQLTPNMFVPSIYAIPLDRLRRRGIRGLIVDLDNTVVPWDEREPSPALQAWVDDVKRAGFGLCLLSNNLTVRVEHFAAALGVPGIPHAGKPRRQNRVDFCNGINSSTWLAKIHQLGVRRPTSKHP